MKKRHISTMVVSALCMLGVSVTPAVAHEFSNESPFELIAKSTTVQTFQLGATDSIWCEKLEPEFGAAKGATSKVLLRIKTYTNCLFTHSGVEEAAALETESSGCEMTLKSGLLVESPVNTFTKGNLDSCTMEFYSANCEGKLKGRSPLSEFQWVNLDTTSGAYKSELIFKLSNIEYEITTKTGCGSSGTKGEYHGSLELSAVIVK